MDKIFVILIISGIVKDASVCSCEEHDAAVSTFKHHYREQIGNPDNDPRMDEILELGYIGFGDRGQNSIQMMMS